MIPANANPSFDATTIAPDQGTPTHPPGMFDATITNTRVQDTRENTGSMFVVEFTTPAGRIDFRYNLWNQSPQAVEIAGKQLSALCHATGIFRVNFNNPNGVGAELRGGRCKIEVAPQLSKDGTPNGYTQIKRVFDAAGNEPGKAPAQAQQPNGFQQPQQQAAQTQPAQSWQPGPGQQTNPAPAAQGWNNPAPAQHQQQPAPQQQAPQQQQPNGWQQAPAGAPGPAQSPPWGQPR